MASSYPGALDAFTNPIATDTMDAVTVPHATQHADVNDAIEAVQGELGTDPAGASVTVKARLDTLDTTVSGKAATVHGHAQADVTDLATDLGLKAPLSSPTFTGTVVLPSTTSVGTVSSTEIGYLDGLTEALSTSLAGKADSPNPTGTNRYITFAASASTYAGADAQSEGRINWLPFYVPVACTINRLDVPCSSAGSAGAIIRMGIYTSSGHAPGTLIEQGTAAAESTGVKTIALNSAVAAGWYWMAAVTQGLAATKCGFRYCQPTDHSHLTYHTVIGGLDSPNYYQSLVTLAFGQDVLPASAPAFSASGGGTMPYTGIRYTT